MRLVRWLVRFTPLPQDGVLAAIALGELREAALESQECRSTEDAPVLAEGRSSRRGDVACGALLVGT